MRDVASPCVRKSGRAAPRSLSTSGLHDLHDLFIESHNEHQRHRQIPRLSLSCAHHPATAAVRRGCAACLILHLLDGVHGVGRHRCRHVCWNRTSALALLRSLAPLLPADGNSGEHRERTSHWSKVTTVTYSNCFSCPLLSSSPCTPIAPRSTAMSASLSAPSAAHSSDPTLERSFRGHKGAVSSVAFAPSLRQLASGSHDHIVMIWNFKPQLRAFRFMGHKVSAPDTHEHTAGHNSERSGSLVSQWQTSPPILPLCICMCALCAFRVW